MKCMQTIYYRNFHPNKICKREYSKNWWCSKYFKHSLTHLLRENFHVAHFGTFKRIFQEKY